MQLYIYPNVTAVTQKNMGQVPNYNKTEQEWRWNTLGCLDQYTASYTKYPGGDCPHPCKWMQGEYPLSNQVSAPTS